MLMCCAPSSYCVPSGTADQVHRTRILRLVSFLCVSVLGSAQTSAPPSSAIDKCKLEGRVVSLSTGEPLKKATLRLRSTGGANVGPINPGAISSYSTTSDAEGKFLFEDLDPGSYFLSAERTGYVRQSYGARTSGPASTIKLDAGQHVQDIVLKLTPQGMLFGKVTDEDGDPLPNAQVMVLRSTYVRGKKQLQQFNANGTRDDGSFVIGNLGPGRYYLSATDNRMMNFGDVERPGRKGPQDGYVTTYFPNTTDPAAAAPIEIAAGNEIRGIEIRLRKARVFRIRGRVANSATGVPPQNLALALIPKDNSNGGTLFGRNMAGVRGKDGYFEFNGVLPGLYVIQPNSRVVMNTNPATGETTQSAPLVGRTIVNVGDDNVENVVVQLGAGAEITGTIKTEGVDPQPAQQQPGNPPARPSIILTAAEGTNLNSSRAQSKDDGSFQLRGVAPDVYRVNITGLPAGTYVKSIRFGGQDVTHANLDLTSGTGGELAILLSPTAAVVTGVVRNSKGDAARDVMVQLWGPGDDIGKFANTDKNGGFRLAGLAPGEYRIVAWEDVEFGLAQDPNFRNRFEGQATSVTLRDNSHETVEVKLVAKDVIEAEAAKIR